MLPVTHGIPYTRRRILIYSIVLVLVTLLPFLIRMSGIIYLATAIALDVRLLYLAAALYKALAPRYRCECLNFP
jgi:heme o synthase